MSINPEYIMPIELSISLRLFRIVSEIVSSIWYFILIMYKYNKYEEIEISEEIVIDEEIDETLVKHGDYLYSYIGPSEKSGVLSKVFELPLCYPENNALISDETLEDNVLSRSRYSLCPGPDGFIRIQQSLREGAIPIIISDYLKLPIEDKLMDLFSKSVLRISEEKVFSIPDILKGISEEEEKCLRYNGYILFEQLCENEGN
jgi:hypothetical protein